MDLVVKHFNELSTSELYEILKTRFEVFDTEQECIYQDMDDKDQDAAKERIFSLLPEDQKEELIALFDEFEDNKTPEAKFAHAMDNLQPLMLNNSNGGADWRAHDVTKEQVYGRQSKTREGSEKLFELTDMIIRQHIEKGNVKE